MARVKKNRISVLNWMATLLVCAIPGVNIIAVICFLIFAKSASKKSFALALLIWKIPSESTTSAFQPDLLAGKRHIAAPGRS